MKSVMTNGERPPAENLQVRSCKGGGVSGRGWLAFSLLLAVSLYSGMAWGGTWEDTMRSERPHLPAKATRSDATLKAAAMAKNGNLSVEIKTAAKKALGATLPDSVTFVNTFKTDEERIDIADFSSNGVRKRIAVYGQLGNFTPYYQIANGLAVNGPADMADFLKRNCGVDEKSSAFAVDAVLSASDVEIKERGKDVASPYERFYFVLVDDRPGAKWAHPCRYVFISEDCTSFTILYKMWHPQLFSKSAKTRIGLSPVDEEQGKKANTRIKSLDEVKEAVYGYANRVAGQKLSYGGDTSHSYYVLICGGESPEGNFTTFWSDTAIFYSTLTKKYGVPKNRIKVYMSDGNSTGRDLNLGNRSNVVLVDAPRDLDNDGYEDVNGAATKSNLSSCFSSLRSSLTSNDQLFVFLTSHGGPDGLESPSNYDCFSTLFDDYGSTYFTDDELASWTSGFACPVVFALDTCYSGGFVDDICPSGSTRKRAIGTACNHYEESGCWVDSGSWLDGYTGKTGACSYWLSPLSAAFRGYVPMPYSNAGGYPWEDGAEKDADSNVDGLVSFAEATAFANAQAAAAQHPQYRVTGGCDPFYLVKQESAPVPSGLSSALDTSLTFTTGGDLAWIAQSSTFQSGSSAAQSGAITDNQNSWFQTTVSGPGTISFYWKVSCESNDAVTWDYLEFLVDGVQKSRIGGVKAWQQYSLQITGSGTHVLKWNYHKDGSNKDGSDCGWVDYVVWKAGSAPTPSSYTVWFSPGAHGKRTGGGAMKQTVAAGGYATAPTITANPGYEFAGWTRALGPVNVHNYTITATYRAKSCGVTFNIGAKGKHTGGGAAKQTIGFGGRVTNPPAVKGYAGWKFLGWDGNIASITRSTTFNAQYDIPVCTATFVIDGSKGRHIGGGDMKQSLTYGGSPVPPGVKGYKDKGYTFSGWSPAVGPMTKSQTYTAVFK